MNKFHKSAVGEGDFVRLSMEMSVETTLRRSRKAAPLYVCFLIRRRRDIIKPARASNHKRVKVYELIYCLCGGVAQSLCVVAG